MATADELLLKIKADASQAEREVSGWAQKVEQKAKKAGKAMQNAGKKMTMGVTLPILGAGAAAVKLFTTQEDATRKLQSTFDSTGAAAWTSVEALQANADALQQITTHGDEAIEEMQSVLLTFTQIKGQEFDGATKSILNMSDALGMDLQGAATMVGKALNDPIAGISAMSRAGITFSEEQKEMIKTMAESGDVAGAQAVMLKELETQFGGTAEAMAETSSGQMKQAMNTMGDSMETVGAIIVPILVNIAGHIGNLAKWFDNLSPGMQTAIVSFVGVVAAIGPVLMVVGKVMQMGKLLITVIKGVGLAMNFLAANPVVLIIIAIVALIAAIVLIIKNWDKVKRFLLKTWKQITDFFEPWIESIKAVWESVWGAVKAYLEFIIDAIVWYVTTYINIVKAVITTVINAIKATWNAVWGAIKATAEAIWSAIVGIITGYINAVQSTILGVIGFITGAWATMTSFLSDAWNGVWSGLTDGIGAAISAVWNIIKNGINNVLAGLARALNGIIKLMNKAIGGYNKIPFAPDIPKIPTVSAPRLAEGGMTNNAGPIKVGERGTEILNVPAGTSIQPSPAGAAGFMVNIERMEGGDPNKMARELGWEFTKRGGV